MIRECTPQDFPVMYRIINEAAKAYEGHIPADCYCQPYMPEDELKREMERVIFFGWEEDGELIGVMGLEPIKEVILVRHAYVLPEHQGKGIGGRMLEVLKSRVMYPRMLVGTWADAIWAVAFYERHGFVLREDKDELLDTYWDISRRQIETSVVLELQQKGD